MEMKTSNNNTSIKAIIDLLDNYPTYCDENNRPHMFIDSIDFLINSKDFKSEIQALCLYNDIEIKSQTIDTAIHILSNQIQKNSNRLVLDYRSVKDENGNLLYQLSKKEMVVISDKDVKILPINKPYFKVSNTFLEQVKPSNTPSIENFLNCLNLDKDDIFLLEVLIIHLFIPEIPKISIVFTGETGTGKSTMTDYIKDLVDPAPANTTKAPKSVGELEKRLSNNYLPCFDNIGKITQEQSDAICRAITGDTHEKIMNDKSYIASYIRAIILNGINCPIYKDDIMDRFLIFKTPKIDRNYQERLLLDEIVKEEKPNALAFIFNTIFIILKINNVYTIDSYEEKGKTFSSINNLENYIFDKYNSDKYIFISI